MKKIILALLMLVGILVPVQVITASSASAATCGDVRYKENSTNVGSSFPGDDQWTVTTGVKIRTCVRDDGATVARVYSVYVKNDPRECGFFNEGIKNNPNVIGTWNPGSKDDTWPASNCPSLVILNWDAPGEWVTVWATDPANERCLGGEWTAYRDAYDDDTDPMATVCVV